MDPKQCEFLAENELIEITPHFNEKEMHLVCGDVGEFIAGQMIPVPLWLAIQLKKQKKCTIHPPVWFTVDELKKLVDEEKQDAPFTSIPERFLEITRILFAFAKDDLNDVDQLRTLVQNLWDARDAKMGTSAIRLIQSQENHAQFDNLTQMEIMQSRNVLLVACRKVEELTSLVHKLN
ncbi:hypothetical protein L596_007293 [Steinernema carpocapsae]|uniref:DNA replication complex GINS protein PSF2 n=1 Tax=Steinernema carpocapsae TaxID=34508 RepID=A0A4U5P8W3_STECR|nr:hypothetical protein L596_007293 [Steinernema carpocapsae]